MTKLMTLATALATGRPFKHKDFLCYIEPNTDAHARYQLTPSSFFEPVWQVQEEEKPPMNVLVSKGHAYHPEYWTIEQLASAISPYIKKELGL